MSVVLSEEALHQAVHTHLAHGAMACDDAFTEALCAQFAPPPELPALQPAASPPEAVPMWPELQRPGLAGALYGGAIVAALVLSHAFASGWLP